MAELDIVVVESTDEDNGYDWWSGVFSAGELDVTDVANMVDQVLEQLSDSDCIKTLMLIGHGHAGSISVGDGQTTDAGKYIGLYNESQWSSELSRLSGKFCTDAEVTLRGCNVGADADGAALVAKLADLWGVTVKAPSGTCYITHCAGEWVTATPGHPPTPVAAPPTMFGLMKGASTPDMRPCCLLVDYDFPVDRAGNTVKNLGELSMIGPHKYGAGMADYTGRTEWSGVVFTCSMGFVDLGHLRDCADLARYYYDLLKTKNKAGDTISEIREGGTITIKKDIPAADLLDVAGAISYEIALYHEVWTYYVLFTYLDPRNGGMKNSSFSPEDLPSNFAGTYVAKKALEGMTAGTYASFDAGVTTEIETLLTALNIRDRATAQAAFAAVDGTWIDTGMVTTAAMADPTYLKRRNLEARAITPWTVPAIADCTSSSSPADFGYGFPAGTTDYFEIEFPVANASGHEQPALGTTIKSTGLDTAITAIRAAAKAEFGPNADQP